MRRGSRIVDQRKLRARKRRRFFFVSFYIFATLVIFLSLASLALSYSPWHISKVSVYGAESVSPTQVESIANEELLGQYFWIFPRTHTFIYPRYSIASRIASIPSVRSVDVYRDGLSAIEIRIEERVGVSIWCRDKCFSVDESGFIFDSVATSSLFTYRGLIGDDPIGKRVISEEEFRGIEFFIRELRSMGLDPVEAIFHDNNYLDVVLSLGGRLIVYRPNDLSNALVSIRSILSDRRISATPEEFQSTLEYLKLDTGAKVLYKRK